MSSLLGQIGFFTMAALYPIWQVSDRHVQSFVPDKSTNDKENNEVLQSTDGPCFRGNS